MSQIPPFQAAQRLPAPFRWDERPVLVCRRKQVRTKPAWRHPHPYGGAFFAKWQLPDDIVPGGRSALTATGKVLEADTCAQQFAELTNCLICAEYDGKGGRSRCRLAAHATEGPALWQGTLGPYR